MIKYLPWIFASVFLNSMAQICIRKGMISVGQIEKSSSEILRYTFNAFSNAHIIGGIICYGFSFLLWMYVLLKVNVSIAYPLGSIGFILVPIIAFFTLGEPLSLYKILGTVIICIGVTILSISPDAL